MRNRLNKLGLESKSHYKLYKSGRRWVAASITVFSVGIGLTFSQVEQVKAATGTGVDTADNSASVSSDMAEPSNAVVLKSASTATVTKTATQDAKAATDVTAATQDTKATTDSTGATSASSNRQSTAATKPAAEVGTASSRADSSASISSTDGASASAPSVTSKSTDTEATSASVTKTATTSADTDVLNTETTSSSVANDLTDATTASQTRTETGKTASIPTAEAPTITTAVTSRALPLTGALASRSANTPVTKSTVQAVSAITSEAETKPTVSLVTTGTVSMDYGEASLADLESHISSPDETPANDVAYYIQDAAGNYLEDVNGNKVNLLYALFLDSADVNDYVDVVYTDEHGQVTKYSGDTDFSTLDQIGSYSVTINAAGKAGMSRVMQDYNAYDTSTSDLDDFVPTFSTGASDYTFTINIVPVKITATTGKNGLIILRPSQLYTGSLTMLPVVTVKNATKQNILQISNGEIGDAKPGVAGKVGQRVLTLADFTYTYQGTETNLTGADTGKYAITLNDAGRKAVQAALGSNYILDDAAVFTTTGAVQAAGLRLTIANDTVTYNGKPQGTSVAVTTGTVYDHFDFTTTTDTNVGTYDNLTYALADPTQAAILAKNYTVTTTDGTLVITPADLTVTVKDDNAVYDGRAHGTTATVTSGTNYDQLAFTAVAADGSGATTYTTVGTYAMTGTTAADTSNYKISYVNGTLTIDPAKATITIPNKIYWSDGTQKNLAAVVTGTVNGETLKYRVTNGMSAVGTKTITATPDADDSVNKNYTISVIPGTLTIGDIAVKYLYEHVDANGETQVDASETGTATHATDATATDYLTYTTAAKPKTGYVLAPNTGLAYNGTLTDQGGTVTYRYLAKTETAIVTYFDQTDNKVIKTEPLQGAYGTTDAYRTADTIAAYENAGYDLVDDDYPTAGVVYDQDGSVQEYQVTLVHKFVTRTPDNPGTPGEPIDPDNPNGPTYPVGTDFEDLTEQVSQTIQYLYKDGRTAKPNDVQAVNFGRNVTVDEVNGTVVYTDWLTDDGAVTGRFEAVDSPLITGYTADPTSVAGNPGVVWQDDDTTIPVTYTVNTEYATVTYFDQTDNKVIKTEPLQGAYGTTDAYRTADTIAAYENAGYQLYRDDYPTAGVIYDHDGSVQKYQVTLVHKFVTRTPDNPGTPGEPIDPDNPNGPTYPVGTDFEDLTEQVSQTIQYLYKDGRTAKPNNVQAVNFSRNVTVDEVNGTVVYTDWLTDDGTMTGRFEAVDSPSITGYTADPTSVAGRDTVSGTDLSPDVQVYYQANPEKATVTYEDTTTGAVLTTDPVTGDYQTVSNYRTADRIAQYLNMGYELVSDDYPTSGAVFDKDGSTQAYTVKLQHKLLPLTPENPGTPGEPIDPDNPNGPTYPAGTAVQDLIKQVGQTIHYQYQDKSTAADANTQTITFKRSVTVDEVNNKLTYTDWLTGTATTGHYMPVDSPEIKGYVADSTRIAGNDEVHNADADTNIVVTYQAKPENATVTYVDVTTGKTLAIKSLTGDYQTTFSYRTAETIASYVKNGYQLVRDNYPTSGAVFDVDNFAKTYTVTLKHKLATVTPENPGTPGQPIDPDNPDGPKYPVGTTAQDLTKQVSQTIKYRYQNGASAGTDSVQLITFNRDATIDEVEPTVVYTDWLDGTSATGRYTTVTSPVIIGYTADRARVTGNDAVTSAAQPTNIIVTYAINAEKATVTYVDVTMDKTLATVSLTGDYQTSSDYRTANTIADYSNQGYVLVRDSYPVSGAIFNDDGVVHSYLVQLAHVTTATTETKTITQTVHYQSTTGTQLHDDTVRAMTFTRTKRVDQVTGDVTYSNWSTNQADHTFERVAAFSIPGYHAVVTGTQAVMVTPASVDDVQTIRYVTDRPSTGETPKTPVKTVTVNKSDKIKTTDTPDKVATVKTPDKAQTVATTTAKQASVKRSVDLKQAQAVEQPAQTRPANVKTVKLAKTTKSVKPTAAHQSATHKQATLPQTNDDRQASVAAELLGLTAATLLVGVSAILKKRHN
ncbi:Mucus-binding protein, LPXTG-motif cell wall anchor [Lactiplantibacillus plantarum]|uniref:mucin-binding protein n=1 Tax=Lactiplantibacillus plantarum TaxID=1590 RepID=UPI000B3CC229|nr:KxYKxGKxW signal peptide domain-containing protein [Lactiplantibacillus plantarum]MCG0592762.1 Mucus-binding protein, LPXTG-motif cell wall anchor [Lactiplantibacillus plantarum]MCG0671498.1 Mucus-binding protein, LPXTG-motif cell wall anchor [Lactiplantibacillus plantarum]MCG0920700.1 Mucus-binding protein, LPXTG-motif cell wall anchor [Lactiplantibacillus plantarum]OUT04636.1 Enolase [Lactiplantibacillus plantarum]OUT05607.1 Enolase [Lactiplantibacillus plantarum]